MNLSDQELEEVRKTVLKAADIMEERGHCVGRFEDPARRVCTAKALSLAAEGDVDADDVLTSEQGKKTARFVVEKLGQWEGLFSFSPICAFNNINSKEHIVSTLRKIGRGEAVI